MTNGPQPTLPYHQPMTILTQTKDIVRVLQEAKTVAVVGFHPEATKPAHYVPEYLHRQGYRLFGVNPALAACHAHAFGHPVLASLGEIREPVDVVEVFRRSDKVREHLADILSMQPLPKVVWLQQGIRDDSVAQELSGHGIDVVQDRCMLSEHRQHL